MRVVSHRYSTSSHNSYAAGEKWGFLVETRHFLFGLVRVPRYEYLWGYSAAQVELLTLDQPVTVYKARERKKASPRDPGYKPPTRQEMDDAYQEWLLRKNTRKLNLKDFLGDGKLPVTKGCGTGKPGG